MYRTYYCYVATFRQYFLPTLLRSTFLNYVTINLGIHDNYTKSIIIIIIIYYFLLLCVCVRLSET